MASISKDSNGHRVIQFVGGDGKRRSIRLGKVSHRAATAIKIKVESLNAASSLGQSLDAETVRWVHNLDARMRQRLFRAGLIDAQPDCTLGPFLETYIENNAPGVKSATVTTWRQCQRLLLEFFEPTEPLRSISEGRAVEWRNYLVSRDHTRIKRARPLSESTIRRRCGCAIQFFEHAVRLRLIERNPFKSKRIPTTLPRPKQKAVVDRGLALQIMDELPNWEYRLVFALARWGGVRVPSEPNALLWSHVDWSRDRFTIPSPKTAHHEGHEQREIPIFPELRQPL